MVVVPLPQPEDELTAKLRECEDEPLSWVGVVASGSLIAGGVLLVTGQRRAGLVAAASGAALAMLDQEETLRSWLDLLPVYIDQIQGLLMQVDGAIKEVDAQRLRLHRVLGR